MIDQNTRLDSTIGGPGLKFYYFYTLINYGPEDVDQKQFIAEMQPKLVMFVKTNTQMKSLRDKKVTIFYVYRLKDNSEFVQIKVAPNDYR